MYIGDYAGRRALYSPDALAVIDAGVNPPLRLSYRDLNERSSRLARWLQDRGVGYRTRVGIIAHNGSAHLELLFACTKLGAISVPYNWRLHWNEQLKVMQATSPQVLLYSEEFEAPLRPLRDRLPSIEHYVALEGEGVAGDPHYSSLIETGWGEPVLCEAVEETDVACLLFTGGTSGLPKGAEITHRQIAWNTLNTVIHDLTHGDITINVFPLFHTGGLFVYTVPLLILGGTVILTRKFEPEQILKLMAQERVSKFAAVPTMYELLASCPAWKDADLSSLKFCTSGGAPLPISLVELYGREKGVVFKQGFGMTEWGPGCFALAPEHALERRGSVGRPNFFVGVRLVDEENRPVEKGEVGELVFKGPSGFSGYFQNPQANQQAFDAQGWFHTGDMARCDEGDFYYIVDRKKDMFISGGENVYPSEIEAVLYTHPAVALCAVIGVPDARWGEVGVAFASLKPGQEASGEALLAHLHDHLARYKVPKQVVIQESLPLSAAGKILKRELRAAHLKT